MSEEQKQLDLSAMDFPVDRLTMKDLRRIYPDLFARGGELESRYPLFGAASLEQEIAQRAYLHARGRRAYSEGVEQNVVDPRCSSRDLLDMLHESYEQCGLSKSKDETREMEAAIKAAARAQAKGTRDRGRGGVR